MIEMLKKMRQITSTLEKQAILKEYKNDEWVGNFLQYAYNPFITFGITDSASFHAIGTKEKGYEHGMVELLDALKDRKMTGNVAKKAISDFGSEYTSAVQYFLLCILKKDLKCGVSTKTINKVFGKDFIPSFELQLCEVYEKQTLHYPVYAQPKFDGARLIIKNTGKEVLLQSRNGLQKDFPALTEEAKYFLPEGMAFDGEIYSSDGFRATMQQFNRKREKNDKGQIFRLFDYIPIEYVGRGVYKKPLKVRKRELKELITKVTTSFFEYVPFMKINSVKELDEYYKKCLAEGYEGIVIKKMDSFYISGRNDNWIKRKPNDTADCQVIGINEGKGHMEGMLGSVTVIVPATGSESNVGGFKLYQRKEFWNDKSLILGKTIEVKYDSITEDGKFRFPRFVRVRVDK